MKTWWLYNTSFRYKSCPMVVKRSLDRAYSIDKRNERPTQVKHLLWKTSNQNNGYKIYEDLL